MTNSADLPSYERPPVIEVVCGIQFEPLDILMTHLGLLWQKYQPDYPTVSEVAPLLPVIEQFEEPPSLRFDFSSVPNMARTWFVHRDGTGIVQVQKDRFLHNWKRVHPTDDYPRYGKVIQLFRNRLTTFQSFVEGETLGALRTVQYEMTYVNHIVEGEGWTAAEGIDVVFPGFANRNRPTQFLPRLETCNWRTTYLLPNTQGRLHVSIRSANRTQDKRPMFVLDLTARGFPNDGSPEAMWAWFDLAHEWIVRGFTDVTGDAIQRDTWRRTR